MRHENETLKGDTNTIHQKKTLKGHEHETSKGDLNKKHEKVTLKKGDTKRRP